jgi:hypothetical protein
MKPQIISPDYGKHNQDLEATAKRVSESSAWKKLDTIVIIPAGPQIPTKVVMSWMNLYSPPNNQLFRMPTIGAVNMEVGEAFSQTIEYILQHPQLSAFKYILTLEHDNIPPPDGLIKLQQQMEAHPEYDCIGGLYFTKGEGGMPQIWGDPRDPTTNFRPQIPIPGALVECCGTGMGFNLWRTDMFRDPELPKPWFKTQTEGGVATQDLYFWSRARPLGYRCAVDTEIKVGHYDLEGKFGPADFTW